MFGTDEEMAGGDRMKTYKIAVIPGDGVGEEEIVLRHIGAACPDRTDGGVVHVHTVQE